VVAFGDLPPILIDATTGVEDRTFWTNTGFDPLGIVAAGLDTISGDVRGASTITQQLVRQRLLPGELVQDQDRRVERKIKEIIQSIRVTQAFPGREGKERIMTAYLNQNFYGNNSYGVAAAADGYFGKELSELTLSEAALLAALPQSPSNYDLVRNAVEDDQGRLIVPQDTDIVERRDFVLQLLADDPARRVLTGDQYSTEDFLAAQDDEVVLVDQELPPWQAPHFIWAVREQLAVELCAEAATCPALERGGLRIVTTLDMELQESAEKWVKAAAIAPHRGREYADRIGVETQPWMRELRDNEVFNGALMAMDYQTGEVVAYVGSADYYESRRINPKFQPQFDVLAEGWRQPGSAFKPFTYSTGLNDRTLTASSMLMDVTTDFGGGYIPKNFDLLERGPLRLRLGLQQSLNIPAIKALAITGEAHTFDMAKRFGMEFQENEPTAGLSMALGTLEVHPADLTNAYATIANGGRRVDRTLIRTVSDKAGTELVAVRATPEGEAIITPQAAHIMTDILAGNTDPAINPIWGRLELTDATGRHRPATLKTGTNNDAKDLTAMGYLAPPDEAGRARGEYALAVGAWNGNSDASVVGSADDPIFSLDVAGPMWQAFLQETTADWAIFDFTRPNGLEEAQVDAFTGYRPSDFSREQVTEIFIEGTVPPRDEIITGLEVIRDEEGDSYLWDESCGGTPEMRGFLQLDELESERPRWREAIQGWIERARRGPGVRGGPDADVATATSYFLDSNYQPYGSTWGAPFPPTARCDEAPSPS
ncbi:MAG: transglycosylase domain-containing protein, partial [Chloroflexota bacterium]|nr:transglycosylase domain-containing protein [Chloroflexota bacterium]